MDFYALMLRSRRIFLVNHFFLSMQEIVNIKRIKRINIINY